MTSSPRTRPHQERSDHREPRQTPLRAEDQPLVLSSARSERDMVFWVRLVLVAIATNAVLIQTIATDNSTLKNTTRVVILLVTVFLMFMRRTIIPEWVVGLALVSAVLLLLTGNLDQLTIIYVLLAVPAMWSIDERALTKSVMIASVFALLLIFALLAAGLTSNQLDVSQTWVSAEVRSRYTFGTASIPFFMNVVYGAAVSVIYYAYRWRLRRRLLLALLMLAGTYWIYTRTDGRGGFLAVLLFCGLAVVLPWLIRYQLFRGLLAIQPVLFLGFTIWLMTQRDDPYVNQFFSFRPMLYGQFFDTTTFWDLLTSTTVKQGEVTTVDSSYLHLLFGAGLVISVVFCILFGKAVLTMARRRMTLELAFLTSVMAYGALESILIRADLVFILFAWYLIMRYSMGEKASDPALFTPKGRHGIPA